YEVIGKTDQELWGEQATSLIANDTEVMTQGNAIIVAESLKTASGQLMHFTGVKMPLRDENNQIIGIIGNSLDITELKEAQTELKKSMELVKAANLAKTEFLENMRHDIRTPLSGIVGFSEILKLESQEPRIKEYADNLAASSHALLDLMDEVLEAVRVSSGEIPKLKKKFDLNLMLNQVINLHKAKASEKKLQLNFIYDNNLARYVIGDKIRLHRIILELIGNALNFTHSGHVTLTAELAKQKKRQLIIKFQVSDSGIGIDKDKQQDIYLQFKRLTPSYKGLYKGAGLGLYIIKQFIDELDGEIYVKSALGCGTTFTCIIPLKAPLLDDNSGIEEVMPEEEQRFLNPVRTLAANPNQPNSVLVVEDSEIAQKVALTILTSMDCVVDLASSGQEALQHIKTKRYDLIFMDIGLGEGADGYEVTKQIRNQEKDKDHTPIVALTAHAAEENKQHCIESGMDAVLSKPITKAHAANIIDHFVRHPETLEREKIEQAKLDLPDNEEELFTLEQFPLLEVEQTLKNLGDKSILIELLNDLVTASIPEDFTRMKAAFAAKDYEQVEKLAHKMKGGAVYVGTLRMKYACQYLERYWKSGQRELFEKLYKQAVSAIEETMSYVKNWLKSSSP
uniref:response regulator n=1 Tax=Legionella nautarum TaxID=45070 RepID=UPI001055C78F